MTDRLPDRLPDEDDEAGEPIAILRGLQVEPSPRFRDRLRNRIERRRVAGDLTGFLWTAPTIIAIEVLRVAFSIAPRKNEEGDP